MNRKEKKKENSQRIQIESNAYLFDKYYIKIESNT
jgi:hypothetical protein